MLFRVLEWRRERSRRRGRSTMARIEGVSGRKAPLWLKPLYAFSRRAVRKLTANREAGVPEPMTILAHRRWMLFAYGMFETALKRSRALDARLKALARLKTSMLTGCPW